MVSFMKLHVALLYCLIITIFALQQILSGVSLLVSLEIVSEREEHATVFTLK